MNAGGWALLGFLLLAIGEVAREARGDDVDMRTLGPFLAAMAALAVALAKHVGIVP